MSDSEIDFDQLHGTLLELMADLQERFGDREPTEDEVAEFICQRLRNEGRSEEEVQEIMRQIAD